ncbi:MAG: trypsin-like peptidase domain-containing protein [Rhodospirillales bacterium]
MAWGWLAATALFCAAPAYAASPWDGEWEGVLIQPQAACSPCKVRLSVQDGVPNIRGEVSIPRFTIDGAGQVTGLVNLNSADFNAECSLNGGVTGNTLSVSGRCIGSRDGVRMTLRRVSFASGDALTGRVREGGGSTAPYTSRVPSVPRSGLSGDYGGGEGTTRQRENSYDRGIGNDRRSGIREIPNNPGTDDDRNYGSRRVPNDRGIGGDRNPNPNPNPRYTPNDRDGGSDGNNRNDRSLPLLQLAAVAPFAGAIVDNMKKILPGVVEIHPKDAIGSGFIIDAAAGLILTDYHVVGTAKTVKVAFSDGEEIVGTVLRRDQARDVALIKVLKKNLSALPIRLSEVVPAEKAYAIGSPFGLSQTVSEGIISSFRKLDGQDFIQATPAISPGNSGGPLIDGSGNVIGISVLIFTPGIGTDFRFFIPIGAALGTLNLKPAGQ